MTTARIDEISELPRATATLHRAHEGSVRANRALAGLLAITHRVRHVLEVATDAPPLPLTPEEKLLRAIFGDAVGKPADGIVVEIGARLLHGAKLVDHPQGKLAFSAARAAEVEVVERETAGARERITVVVRWTGELAVGDVLWAGDRRLGMLDGIVDDGAAEPRLYLDGAVRAEPITVERRLPTAAQQLEAHSISEHDANHRPLAGQVVRADQIAWLANTGGRALVGEFAAYKLGDPMLSARSFEAMVKLEPLADGWTATRPPPAVTGSQDTFATSIGSGLEVVRRLDVLARACGLAIAQLDHGLELAVRAPGSPHAWSSGEVRTGAGRDAAGAPIPGGLHCERLFGPVRDYECACGKHKRMRDRGIVCSECGVEVLRSAVRRERFGHVTLAAPVVPTRFAARAPEAWSVLPILPPELRPPELDECYRAVIAGGGRDAVDAAIACAFDLVVAALLPGDPHTDFSAAAIAMVDHRAGTGRCRVPNAILVELARPMLYGVLESLGYTTTIKSAKHAIDSNAELRHEALRMTLHDRVVLLAGPGPELVAARVDIGDEPVVRIDPELARRLGVATGDRVALHMPLTDAGQAEAKALGSVRTPIAPAPSWLRALAEASDRLGTAIALAVARPIDPCTWPAAALLAGGYPPDGSPPPRIELGPPPPPPPPPERSAEFMRSVDELELSVAVANILARAQIKTIGDLAQRTESEMLKMKGVSRARLRELKEVLASMGLMFGMRI